MKLDQLLDEVRARTADKFDEMPKVESKSVIDLARLPVGANIWHHLEDLVAVFFDMKSSTNLEKGRRPASTASIYDAGVGGVVKILDAFEADFVDIQGDGGFGLFWGENRYERAMCGGISIRTFGIDFTKQLNKKWPSAPSTGFKVGVASGPVLVKKVGLPKHMDLQEPVWAGRPVNYAAKAAQQTDPEHLLVTGSVWDQIATNDYLAFSCGCGDGVPNTGTPTLLWEDRVLDKIPDDDRFGQALKSGWCANHGEQYCNAILKGETHRDEVSEETRGQRAALALGSSLERYKGRQERQLNREEFQKSFNAERAREARAILDAILRETPK
ncbi:hypothetical protein [Arthrobacter globiformis]|uniref:hypothetical protein n=1 Tax=Arthrobacter globiformis TaxID=1665 RepID=UPI000B421CA4|nr:hypothetical protein [Arthrobacter globiformis]